MPITTRNHNPFPDCVGLDQSVPQGLQNDFPLIVELRFGWEQKLWENVSLRMGIRGGIVHLDLKGCEITKGSRFAEYRRDKAAVERITYRDRQERSSKVELTGRLTLDPSTPAGRVGTDARVRGKSTTSMDRVIKREQHLVNLASGGTDEQASWRVRALVGEEVLEGQYLGAESLCDVRETPNNSGVAGVMATTA